MLGVGKGAKRGLNGIEQSIGPTDGGASASEGAAGFPGTNLWR